MSCDLCSVLAGGGAGAGSDALPTDLNVSVTKIKPGPLFTGHFTC